MERRLATIMALDVVGYSAKMGVCEARTLAQLSFLKRLIEDRIANGGGRMFATAGDGFLLEFSSPVCAVQTGFQIQRYLQNAEDDETKGLELRIGIHLADVVVDGDNLLGDGVNIAARIEGAAEPGAVLVSQAVFDQVKRTAQLSFEDLGEHALKNISDPLRLFKVVREMGNHSYISGNLDNVSVSRSKKINAQSLVVLPFKNLSGDPEQDYFSDGFTEDLITELSRFRDILVVSRNTSFALKEQDLDVGRMGLTNRYSTGGLDFRQRELLSS